MAKFVVPPRKAGTGRRGNTEHPRISFGFYKNAGDEKGQTDIMSLSTKEIAESQLIYNWLGVSNPTDAVRVLLYNALKDTGLLKE